MTLVAPPALPRRLACGALLRRRCATGARRRRVRRCARCRQAAPLPAGWEHGAFMEVFVRSYQDSDGDGIGDLRGLTQRLDYLQALGIKGLWLMPVNASGDHDHGYARDRLPRHRARLRHAGRLRRAGAPGPRARHRHRDRLRDQPQLEGEPAVRAVGVGEGEPVARLVRVGGRQARRLEHLRHRPVERDAQRRLLQPVRRGHAGLQPAQPRRRRLPPGQPALLAQPRRRRLPHRRRGPPVRERPAGLEPAARELRRSWRRCGAGAGHRPPARDGVRIARRPDRLRRARRLRRRRSRSATATRWSRPGCGDEKAIHEVADYFLKAPDTMATMVSNHDSLRRQAPVGRDGRRPGARARRRRGLPAAARHALRLLRRGTGQSAAATDDARRPSCAAP